MTQCAIFVLSNGAYLPLPLESRIGAGFASLLVMS